MYPMHEYRGLCLVSTAIQKGDLSALASQTNTSGTMTRYLCLLTIAELLVSKQRCQSTENVLPLHGVLAGNPAVQLERNRVSEPSLSAKAECLSLQAQDCTNVQNSQIEKGAAFLPIRRTQGTPAVVC